MLSRALRQAVPAAAVFPVAEGVASVAAAFPVVPEA